MHVQIGKIDEEDATDEYSPADARICGVDANQRVLHAKLDGYEFPKTLCGQDVHGRPTSIPVRLYGHAEYRWCKKCAKELIEHNHVLPVWENRRKRPRKATCEQQSSPTG